MLENRKYPKTVNHIIERENLAKMKNLRSVFDKLLGMCNE